MEITTKIGRSEKTKFGYNELKYGEMYVVERGDTDSYKGQVCIKLKTDSKDYLLMPYNLGREGYYSIFTPSSFWEFSLAPRNTSVTINNGEK